MSDNTGEGAGQPEQTPGIPDEATLGALGRMVVAGAEQLTEETIHGEPSDRLHAMQNLAEHPTLQKILETAEKIKSGELPSDGRI